ncbi:MAG: diadenylate cyclase [Thermodesulfobacteriota bacterium]
MQILQDILDSISVANAVDILIMATLTYFVLAWLWGRRALQILATLLGMGIFYYFASSMGLVMTSVIFQYLWAAIILVLVIVFQPEIREMLERASPMRYLSGRHPQVVGHDVIAETVKAVAELARHRLGALIVFQRTQRLGSLILHGKALDSLVSAEELLAIFHKNSPLHDGAVVIFEDRIKEASCILPLSTDESLSSRYGTRHRAAIGLSERSDAVCVVVSEERGEVSLVEEKQISTFKRRIDFHQALQQKLTFLKQENNSARSRFMPLLTSNWGIKCLALATAILMWVLIVGPQTSEVGISVPIQYTNLPAGMEITGKWMDRIDVRVRGSETNVANLKPGSVRTVIDLSRVLPGLNFFRISTKNLQVPPGISITSIRPADLSLTIAAGSMRKMKVSPQIVGSIPENVKIMVKPQEVEVRGLASEVSKVSGVATEPVQASELLEKRTITLPLMVKPDGAKVDGVFPVYVTVSVEARSP